MRTFKAFILGICLVSLGANTLHANPVGSKEELRAKVVSTYTSQIGVRELTGNNDGVQVEKYLAVTGFKKGAPWCVAFVAWVFDENHVTTVKSAWAPSWFTDSHTYFIRNSRPMATKPIQADVFGLYSASKGLIYHGGFIDAWPDGDYAITVEGNTNNAGSSEGDGVYRKRRPKVNLYALSRWI